MTFSGEAEIETSMMALGLSRRLERINRTTLEFLDAGLHIRVPLNGSGDEFDRLATNLNRMLGRIEQLMEISDAGLIMAPKSTWFEPKLRSGFFVHTF